VIPDRYTGEGGNVSPALAWSCAPLGTNLVLVVDDVDAPGGSFIHWVVLALTPDGVTTGDGTVGEGADPGGVLTGTTDAGRPGWIGPLPPPGSGPHEYVFTAYAVADVAPPTDPTTTADQLLAAIDGHVVATATLTGTSER
jgi:Raf kinase inhibitor-like YbhB/YbcL family protein